MADFTQLLSQFLYARLPLVGGSGGSASGVLTVSTASAATIADTNETDLWTYSLPANTLGADGRCVRVTVIGSTGATANTKTVRLYYGGSVIRTVVNSASNNETWYAQAVIFRTAASAQETSVFSVLQGSVFVTRGTAAVSNSSDQIIKITGQNGTAAANDIVFKSALVELLN